MSKHTPAPWKVHKNIGKNSEIGIIADEAPCIICTMSNAKAWPQEAEANARLIAAAPDLLAALKAITERAEDVSQKIPVENRSEGVSQAAHVRHMASHLAQHAKIARDIITKAEA